MKLLKLITIGFVLAISGCATYTTPGGSVELSQLAEADINELMSKQPAASFPANIAIVRVQAPGYRSHRADSFGHGRYSIVTTRETESEEDYKRLSNMPYVSGIAPLNRLLLPSQLDSIKALREAAARLKTDILLIYTFNTTFHVGEQKLAPLNVVLLGLLNNREVTVTTTVSTALFDVRTEYLYGLAEATAKESKYTSVWGTSGAVDDMRLNTEKKAFQTLLPEIEGVWESIVSQYAKK